MNSVHISGRLGKDPELRFTNNNTAIAKFSLAVRRRYKDKQSGEWKEDTDWVDVKLFGNQAEAFCRHHVRGDPALAWGALRQERWDDKATGKPRSRLVVHAQGWEFMKSKNTPQERGGHHESSQAPRGPSPTQGQALAQEHERGGEPQRGSWDEYAERTDPARTQGGSGPGVPAAGDYPEDDSMPF